MSKARELVVGYVRVSTREQSQDGHSLDAQKRLLRETAREKKLNLVDIIADEGISAKSLERDGIQKVLAMLNDDSNGVQKLLVAKLDRLARNLVDLKGLVDSRKNGWTVMSIGENIDTAIDNGASAKLHLNMLGMLGEYERDLISERTRAGLAEARKKGIKLGRPSMINKETARLIQQQHDSGKSLNGIARFLNEQGTPTARGGKRWYASTVTQVLKTVEYSAEVKQSALFTDI